MCWFAVCNVLLAAACSGHKPAAHLLCRLYSDSTQSGALAIDPDLTGAAYQAAVAGLDWTAAQQVTYSAQADGCHFCCQKGKQHQVVTLDGTNPVCFSFSYTEGNIGERGGGILSWGWERWGGGYRVCA